MSKDNRIKKLKEEKIKLAMAAKGIGPRVNPNSEKMILQIIRAFEQQHKTYVQDAEHLARYITMAHQGALEKGFFAYHVELMNAIERFFDTYENNVKDTEYFNFQGLKKDLLAHLNLSSDNIDENQSVTEDPRDPIVDHLTKSGLFREAETKDGNRATRKEKIHPLEQSED